MNNTEGRLMTTDDQLAFTYVVKLQELYWGKKLSPVETTTLLINRIEKLNGKLNAFLECSFDNAMESARVAEKEIYSGVHTGLLQGIPIGIKDLELTKDLKTTSGSLIHKDFIPDSDSVVVKRIKSAGAIILGKTNTPEFGLLGETKNLLGDHCRNPWNNSKTAGGSSGGSAAAIASGMCPVASGSDGGGSIRIPASFTGTYGIKPTQGRVPRPNLIPPISSHTSQPGPMARSVKDCALLFQVMAGHDSNDIFSLTDKVPNFIKASEKGSSVGIQGLKMGWTPDFGFAKVDPQILSICEKAARSFESLGCSVENSDFQIEDPFMSWLTLFSTGSLASNAQYWPDRSGEMTDYARDIYGLASNFTAADFSRGVANIQTIRNELNRQFEEFDVLLSPTMAVPPYDCGEPPTMIDGKHTEGSWECLPFTYPINSAGYPAASIPAGMTKDGLPVGLHIIGKFADEETVIRVSAAFEAAYPWAHLYPTDKMNS